MTITLESSIIHILNTAEEYPILSNRPFHLDSEVKDGYRLSLYLFSMGFPFSFPFTASEKRIYACSDGKVSAKKMSGEGHSPDTFSINFPSSLRCFASFGL